MATESSRFDWNLIRSFLAVLDRGSLSGAARQLGASQPTVGRHVAELEAQLGMVLFERTGRGLMPTSAALDLADAARGMEDGANELARCVAGRQQQQAGTVRISASQPVACHLLPPVLRAMHEALPHIQVELVSTNAMSDLLRREADIALRMLRPTQGNLIARKIGEVRLGIWAHRSYLAKHGAPQQPADLLRHTLIGNDQLDDILKGFAAFGMPVPREAFAFRTDDLNVQWEAIRAGLGIGFVAGYVAGADPDVAPILPALTLPTLPIWLVAHREVRTGRHIRAVYDFLAEAVPQRLNED